MVSVSVRYGQASHCRCILSRRLHTVSLSPSHGRYSVRYPLKLVAVISWEYFTHVQHALPQLLLYAPAAQQMNVGRADTGALTQPWSVRGALPRGVTYVEGQNAAGPGSIRSSLVVCLPRSPDLQAPGPPEQLEPAGASANPSLPRVRVVSDSRPPYRERCARALSPQTRSRARLNALECPRRGDRRPSWRWLASPSYHSPGAVVQSQRARRRRDGRITRTPVPPEERCPVCPGLSL
ncbi:hypothetical protein C8Q78DRAFT_780647 [Trametes maxima]|nr:hypothetical protein C8Q78DRAFT_780647 [Trametes maxima]